MHYPIDDLLYFTSFNQHNMAQNFFSRRDLDFLLHEVFQVAQLTQYPYFQDHSPETFEMVLDAASQFAESRTKPLLTEMDRLEPQLVEGQIRISPKMHPIIAQFGQDGWINAGFGYEEGGQQLPATVLNAAAFIFQAANYSSSVFPFLTTGAANLLRSFGSDLLKKTFTPYMYDGQWQGTMALTEPGAGSSLSDITTTASPTEQPGVYRIQGQKVFISAGDHDGCENIVHLMLAKIKGGPSGAKGISLFVVPKKRLQGFDNQHEVLGAPILVPNDVQTAGIYHKMGYKGAPIAHLMMGAHDDCHGYLVGEPHQGLRYMFQMMNEARIGVGMNAAAIGTAAYYASLEYARERPQGRVISDKDVSKPQTLIINHADVKRMLLFQKSIVEGSLSLLMQCGLYADLAHVTQGEERERYELLLDLLTPVAKSYPSEMCCLTTSAAVQILGGYGYTTDFPVEQFYREARIHPIHEGTTGIHGMDLLGRKIVMKGGQAVAVLMQEMLATIREAHRYETLKAPAKKLQEYLAKIEETTTHLLGVAGRNTEQYLSDATLYLEMFGIVTIAWQWLKMGITIQQSSENATDFAQGKMFALRYFYGYELPKIQYLAQRLCDSDPVTVEMQSSFF
jgi:alkylation response protein AidB-like acyl-CoA dehydrogenase